MAKLEILGHTFGAVFKKEFFSEDNYYNRLLIEDRRTRKMIKKGIIPTLRQAKISFDRTCISVDIYKAKDFNFKKPVSHFCLNYREIDRVEIYVFGNNNKEKFYRDFKICFYNELDEEIFYLNFGSNNEFYGYQDSLKGFQILMAQLYINNIEHDVYDETTFR